jgi:TolB-like protein
VYKVLTAPEDAGKVIGDIPKSSAKNWTWATIVVASIIITSIVWLILKEEPTTSEIPSIAVLPFDNMSNDPEQEYFADGMTDELIGDLAKIKDIFVISRNSAFTYKGKSIKVQEVANDLNVRYILEGSVQRSGNKVRIRAQLIDGKTDHHLWSESYDGVMNDIFDLQDKITGKIVSALAIKLTPDEKDQISEKGTDNLLAYDAYLKGFEHYSLMTGENLLKAVEYYRQAIEIDPDFSRAYTALAATYWMMRWHGFAKRMGMSNPMEIMTLIVKARHYLEIAMQNPNFEAYRLASWFDVFRRNYVMALANAEKALALAPNSNIAHGNLSNILNWIGRPDEALLHLDKAMKLDPKFVDIFLGEKGKTYYLLGDYNKAVELIERSLKLNPGLTAYATYAAASYAFLGQQDEADRAWKIFKDGFSFGFSPTTKFLYYGFPFKDQKVFDRFLEGLVKAGFQGDPSDYYIVHKNSKLSGDQIQNQFYGKTTNGYHMLGGEIALKFDTSGEVEFSYPQFGFSDKAKSFVENDQLCFEFEKWYEGIKSCSDYYNIPEGTHSNKSQFIKLNDIGMGFLSIQE